MFSSRLSKDHVFISQVDIEAPNAFWIWLPPTLALCLLTQFKRILVAKRGKSCSYKQAFQDMEKYILACGWIDFTWSKDVLVILFLITRGPLFQKIK